MRTRFFGSVFAGVVALAGSAVAQLGTPIPNGAYDLVPIAQALAIPGGTLAETGWLGIESFEEDAAWDRHFWATTRGTGAAGGHYIVDIKEDPLSGGIVGVASYAQGAASGGVWGYRDLAFDGAFLYAGVEGGFIHEFDPYTGAPTGNTISLAAAAGLGGLARALAFRYSTDTFIAANFNSIVYEIDRNGNAVDLTAAATGHAHYGFAITTNFNPPTGGPAGSVGEMLWSYQQTGNTLVEFAFTGAPGLIAPTGISFPQTIPPFNTAGIAGGACSYADSATGMHEIATLVQGTPNDAIVRYEHSPDPCGVGSSTTVGSECCDPGPPPPPRSLKHRPYKASLGRVLVMELRSCVGAAGSGLLMVGLPGPWFPAFWAPAGCFVEVVPLVMIAVAIPAPPGVARVRFYIPIDPLLCGATLGFQSFQFYGVAPPPGCSLPICSSKAWMETIGS